VLQKHKHSLSFQVATAVVDQMMFSFWISATHCSYSSDVSEYVLPTPKALRNWLGWSIRITSASTQTNLFDTKMDALHYSETSENLTTTRRRNPQKITRIWRSNVLIGFMFLW